MKDERMITDDERSFREWRSPRREERRRIQTLLPQDRTRRITRPRFPPPQIDSVPPEPLLLENINQQTIPTPNIDESTWRSIPFPILVDAVEIFPDEDEPGCDCYILENVLLRIGIFVPVAEEPTECDSGRDFVNNDSANSSERHCILCGDRDSPMTDFHLPV